MAGTQREPGFSPDPQSEPAPWFAEPTMRFKRPEGSLLGSLLVATPSLEDPSFERTVVLLMAHEEAGAMGVVLNRATEVRVAEVLGSWGQLADEPSVLFEGGPVQPESAICVAQRAKGATEPEGFQRFFGPLGTVDLGRSSEELGQCLSGVRVFAGYAGWGAGQLEAEIESGSWFTFDALPADVFMTRPDDLWAMVLRRQGGVVAAVAHYPADPTMN